MGRHKSPHQDGRSRRVKKKKNSLKPPIGGGSLRKEGAWKKLETWPEEGGGQKEKKDPELEGGGTLNRKTDEGKITKGKNRICRTTFEGKKEDLRHRGRKGSISPQSTGKQGVTTAGRRLAGELPPSSRPWWRGPGKK